MEKVPQAQEREALIEALADLIATAGPDDFVAAPILEPSERCFPDRWEANARGVHTLARRLLGYAGLGHLEVAVELDERIEVAEADEPGRTTHHGAAAWFYGIEENVCLLGASQSQLDDAEHLVGIMAHETAHAWRTHRGVVGDDRDHEEQLTDLTTIYLGFGILTANAAQRYRAAGELRGGSYYLSYSHVNAGYLSPQAMAFALACQVVARRMPPKERRRVAAGLLPNQAACFHASCALLDGDDLARRLGLPPRERWPVRAAPAPEPLAVDDEPLDEPAPAPVAPTEAAPVFRVIGRHTFSMTLGGFFAAMGVFLLLSLTVGGEVASALAAVGVQVLAVVIGRAWRDDYCSACRKKLPGGVTVCRGCGGRVARTITTLADKYDDED